MKAVFLSLNALGDTLCTTPAIHAFRRANPDATIVYIAQSAPFCRVLDNNPDIDLLLYSEDLYFRGLPKPEETNQWLNRQPIDLREQAMLYRLDLKLVCLSDEVFTRHISQAFAKLIEVEIESTRPLIFLNEHDRRSASVFARRPYVVFSMHSVANSERPDGRGRKKDWPMEHWQELARRIHELDQFDIYLIGSERDPWPPIPEARRLYGLPIRTVAALLESAACVITLESGIGHLCAAVDAPMIQIYSNMMPIGWAKPADGTRARSLYGDPFDLSVDTVFHGFQQMAYAQTAVA